MSTSKVMDLVRESATNAAPIEEWKPKRITGDDQQVMTNNCTYPFPGLIGDPWQPPHTTTQITIQPTPDMTVNVWKAENGFMVEIGGKKYIAKSATDIAELFIKEFGDGEKA